MVKIFNLSGKYDGGELYITDYLGNRIGSLPDDAIGLLFQNEISRFLKFANPKSSSEYESRRVPGGLRKWQNRLQAEDYAEQIKFFTPEQAALFLEYIEKPYIVKVGGHERTDDTGLRKGELLVLQWQDIDFTEDQIRVSKAVTVVDGKQIIKSPKTKTSIRTVSIPHSLTIRLQRLKNERIEYRLKLGRRWKGDNWLFIQENGRMMNYSTPIRPCRTQSGGITSIKQRTNGSR